LSFRSHSVRFLVPSIAFFFSGILFPPKSRLAVGFQTFFPLRHSRCLLAQCHNLLLLLLFSRRSHSGQLLMIDFRIIPPPFFFFLDLLTLRFLFIVPFDFPSCRREFFQFFLFPFRGNPMAFARQSSLIPEVFRASALSGKTLPTPFAPRTIAFPLFFYPQIHHLDVLDLRFFCVSQTPF